MNDTHGEQGEGWYGFDLDGTLAKYDGWKGIDHIGEPVKPMVELIKRMHDEGKVVKIVTARVAPKEQPEVKPNPYREGHWCIESPDLQTWALKNEWSPREFIQEWCYRILGFVPEIVYQKDHLMLELYDDRVKQVVPNEGVARRGHRRVQAAEGRDKPRGGREREVVGPAELVLPRGHAGDVSRCRPACHIRPGEAVAGDDGKPAQGDPRVHGVAEIGDL